ncbi:helix-turn-helix domain-containing protein [Lentzea sp. E54]|uniref:helix-turn-helix domain-containing protein n=1 Tax=Lentzea xerophila TaxID=3435883 RepID=UPI003DA218C8
MISSEPRLDGSGMLRPEIEASWRRSLGTGLSPLSTVHKLPILPIRGDSALLHASTEVLDQMARDIGGIPLSVVLADADGKIVGSRIGRARLGADLAASGVVVGRRFTEESSGTNSISLALALGRKAAVIGEEHFLNSFKRFACFGHPITDPATGDVVGVLNLVCAADLASPMGFPFIASYVREIENRLGAGAGTRSVTGSALIELERDRSAQRWLDHKLARYRELRLPVLVAGERGTGRTTMAQRLAGAHPVLALNLDETVPTAHEVVRLCRQSPAHRDQPLLVVDDIDRLNPEQAMRLVELLDSGTEWIAMVSRPASEIMGVHRELVSRCVGQIDLPSLRDRVDELPALVSEYLALAGAAGRLSFAPNVWQTLREHPWFGNFHELFELVNHLLALRISREVTVLDLPERFRGNPEKRPQSLIEKAEYELILKALHACAGNRGQAARYLGISRSTLHRRLRSFGIDAYLSNVSAGACQPGSATAVGTA